MNLRLSYVIRDRIPQSKAPATKRSEGLTHLQKDAKTRDGSAYKELFTDRRTAKAGSRHHNSQRAEPELDPSLRNGADLFQIK